MTIPKLLDKVAGDPMQLGDLRVGFDPDYACGLDETLPAGFTRQGTPVAIQLVLQFCTMPALSAQEWPFSVPPIGTEVY